MRRVGRMSASTPQPTWTSATTAKVFAVCGCSAWAPMAPAWIAPALIDAALAISNGRVDLVQGLGRRRGRWAEAEVQRWSRGAPRSLRAQRIRQTTAAGKWRPRESQSRICCARYWASPTCRISSSWVSSQSACSSSPSSMSSSSSRDPLSPASTHCWMPPFNRVDRLALEIEGETKLLVDGLADAHLSETLQVGHPLEVQDALDELLGILHLVDRLVVEALRQTFVAPVRRTSSSRRSTG